MRIVVIVLLGFAATACVGVGSNAQAADAEIAGERVDDDPMVDNTITATPRTFEAAVTDETRKALEIRLERGSLDVVRLVVRGLHPRAARDLKGVRIFIEKPDADSSTPVEDPHYAGNFVLGLEASQTIQWNVAPTLARLWKSGKLAQGFSERKTLRITFVPEPWDYAARLPKDFALPFDSVTFEVPADE